MVLIGLKSFWPTKEAHLLSINCGKELIEPRKRYNSLQLNRSREREVYPVLSHIMKNFHAIGL